MRTTWGDSERGRELLAAALIGGFGVGTFLVHAEHLANHTLPALAVLFGGAIPILMSVALVGAAIWLVGAGFGGRAPRIAAWCFVGAVVLLAVGGAFAVFELDQEAQLVDLWIVFVAQATFGGLLGVLMGVYDTQRLVTRIDLRHERETADQLGRRLTVLNRVLRHDIRNSVNVIRGNAEIIVEGTSDPTTAAETVRDQATEMARLSEQAREIEAALSDEELETERFDLGTAVSGKALALSSRHEYVSVHRSIDDAWVEASPIVETAIEKLLENAIRHNDATDPSVWVDVSTGLCEGRAVVSVQVEDNGPGIPPEQIAVLQRGRETTLEHTSGLGLWLVHWIVTASGGEVSYEERAPRGSVVELVLPRADPGADETDPT